MSVVPILSVPIPANCLFDVLLSLWLVDTITTDHVALFLNSNQAFDGRWSGIGASAIGACATTGV